MNVKRRSLIGLAALLPAILQIAVVTGMSYSAGLDLGTRLDIVEYKPNADSAIEARSFSPFGISGGALWKFADGYNAALTLSRNQRAPQIDQARPRQRHPGQDRDESAEPEPPVPLGETAFDHVQ